MSTIHEPASQPKSLEKVPVPKKSVLGAKLAAGKFVAFVEILPPRGIDASKEVEGVKLCKAAGIDCINVPDGPRASARMSAQVTCQLEFSGTQKLRPSSTSAAATGISSAFRASCWALTRSGSKI